uniref:NADH-ubiquinone oxidoreductase chain 6 n=1 Tax=Phratora vulgatissima TaxID=878366 RepID=A0A1P8NN34_9CUCU|nr:NADH dehydrogenase subunit 6 [Phratora vulgatissima]
MSILMFMWMVSIMLMFLNHPLSLGMILLTYTILVSLLTGMMNYNYWFSYILFLIMIGGMLILFIYMTSIASNEKFKFSSKLFIMFIMFMFIMFLSLMMDTYYMNMKFNLIDMMNQCTQMNFKLSITKYMNYPQNLVMMIMIMYLFITLIMVTKMTNINHGPLRQKY